MLQCVAVCYSALLHFVAVCCSVADVSDGARNVSVTGLCDAECCSVLQSVAECCSVLQCVTAFCCMLQCVAAWKMLAMMPETSA